MTGYTFTLSCPTCGAPVRHSNDGQLHPHATCAGAVCTECGAHMVVDVRLRIVRDGKLPKPTVIRHDWCGTVRGHAKHMREGERACEPCKAAHNADRAARRAVSA